MRRRYAIVLMMILGLYGCQLESPMEFGEACENVRYVLNDDGEKCEGEDCRYAKYFEVGTCPGDYPHCIQRPDQDAFCASDCVEGTHEIKNPDGSFWCEADTPEHCGPLQDNCTAKAGWATGVCEAHQCKAESCIVPYKPVNGECRMIGDCCGWACARCASANLDAEYVCSGISDADDCIRADTCGGVICDKICVNPKDNDMFCGADKECKHFVTCGSQQTCVSGTCIER